MRMRESAWLESISTTTPLADHSCLGSKAAKQWGMAAPRASDGCACLELLGAYLLGSIGLHHVQGFGEAAGQGTDVIPDPV